MQQSSTLTEQNKYKTKQKTIPHGKGYGGTSIAQPTMELAKDHRCIFMAFCNASCIQHHLQVQGNCMARVS